MKQSDLLTATSILSVILLALHISQDIVFSFDRGGLNQLVGVASCSSCFAAPCCCGTGDRVR